MTPKFVGVKPNDAELMTITGAQVPSGIPYVAPIVKTVDLLAPAESVLVLIQVSVVGGLGETFDWSIKNCI